MTTTAQPLTPQPIDLVSFPHLQGVFAPVVEGVDVSELVVEGRIPDAIDGDYVRNGPNPRFTPLGGYLYPLDGDGMVHRVQIRDGRARYTNRFVRTPALVAEEAAGKALWTGLGGFGYTPGADLVGPELAHTRRPLPSINVVRHGGRLLALAESNQPFALTAELATLGPETFCDTLPAGVTAHPKIDPATGEMVVFCYGLQAPYLTWSIIASDGHVTRAATPVPEVARPVMIHDMALTPTYVVLVLGPLFFDLAATLRGGSPLSWQPQEGTRIALIPRDGTAVSWLHTDAFWLWHTANAFDVPGSTDARPSVVLDYVEWTSPGGFSPSPSTGRLARAVLNPVTGRVEQSTLSDRAMEFPRIDDRLITRPHPVIATSLKTGGRKLPTGDADTLAWYRSGADHLTTWFDDNLAVGEQVFIPEPGATEPAAGWWTTIATDRTDLTSSLLIFPAADPGGGPIAKVRLPRRVPGGLHGAWLPTEE